MATDNGDNGNNGNNETVRYQEGEDRRTSTLLQRDLHGLYLHQHMPFKKRDPKNSNKIQQVPDPENPSRTIDKVVDMELVKLIGKGGMATTYLGRTEDSEEWAVKILPVIPGNEDNKKFVDRFEDEARLLHKVTKRDLGFVQMVDSGRTRLKASDNSENEVLYITMQYIEHENLTTKTLSIPEATDIMIQVAKALRNAHNLEDENGVVHPLAHRDIKPENILVDKDGVAHLADLGVGKDLKGKSAAATVGGLSGTPSYMSPEQANGLEVNDKTDIYSWGTTFVYLLTKSLPFDGDSPLAIVGKVRDVEKPFRVIDEKPDVPPKLSEIIEISTNKFAEPRFDAKELVHALEMYKEGHGYMQEDRDKILQATKTGFWERAKGLKKEKLIELIKAHEKASWFTSGRERRAHQEKIIEYYRKLEISQSVDEVIPEDIDLALIVAQKQMDLIEITPEIEPERLEGRGIGKKKAEALVNKIKQEAGKFWVGREYGKAETIMGAVKAEWEKLRDKWKPVVREWITHYDTLIGGSKKAQQANIFIDECNRFLTNDELERALRAHGEAKNLLDQILENPPNPHRVQLAERLKKTDEKVNREVLLYRVAQLVGDMASHIDTNQFGFAHQDYNQIMVDLNNSPPSDKGDRLRRQAKDMNDLLVKSENFFQAGALYRAVLANIEERTENGYKEAQKRAVTIDGIIATHIQGDDPREIEFRAKFIKLQGELTRKTKQFEEFSSIAKEYNDQVYPMYEEHIDKKFSAEELPDLNTLKRFHSGVQDLIRRISKVHPESVGPEYEVIRQGMIRVQMDVAQKEKEYVDSRFKEVEAEIAKISEKENQENNKAAYDSAIAKLRTNRQVVNLLDAEEIYQRYDKMEEKVREQYEFARVVGRARKEILGSLYDEARKTLDRVPEGREKDVEVYLRIIGLEEKARNPVSRGTCYFLKIRELDDETVAGYKGTIQNFEGSEEAHQVMTMLDDIKAKVPFGEESDPVSEVREMVDNYNRKRSGSSKDELKAEILERLNGLVDSIETYLNENGQPVLTRDMRAELGTSYQDADFRDKAKEFF
ncbi:serine/threonine protein kinase [Candidatus Woesearchaeota archaeon]|nr:serine/threonine protein kinase [Candidatus Woesearchaeota archaeon]